MRLGDSSSPYFPKVGKIVKEKWHKISLVYLTTIKYVKIPPNLANVSELPLDEYSFCKGDEFYSLDIQNAQKKLGSLDKPLRITNCWN